MSTIVVTLVALVSFNTGEQPLYHDYVANLVREVGPKPPRPIVDPANCYSYRCGQQVFAEMWEIAKCQATDATFQMNLIMEPPVFWKLVPYWRWGLIDKTQFRLP